MESWTGLLNETCCGQPKGFRLWTSWWWRWRSVNYWRHFIIITRQCARSPSAKQSLILVAMTINSLFASFGRLASVRTCQEMPERLLAFGQVDISWFFHSIFFRLHDLKLESSALSQTSNLSIFLNISLEENLGRLVGAVLSFGELSFLYKPVIKLSLIGSGEGDLISSGLDQILDSNHPNFRWGGGKFF